LVAISFCKFLYGFYTSAIGSMLVPIGETFKINLKTQSLIFPFNYIGQIVIIFFVGYFADKLGKKFVQITLIILLGVFAVFFNRVENFTTFMVFFLFMGLSGTSINTIADAAVSDTFSKKKGFYLNIAHAFFGLGALTSPIVFNYIYTRTQDFRTVYFVLFIIAIMVTILISIARYPTVDNERIRPIVIVKMLRNKNFLILCLYALLSAGSMHSVSGWIPTLFQKNLNISASISNYSLSFFWLSVVIGRIIVAILSKKYEEYKLLKFLNLLIFIVLGSSFFLNSYIFLLIDYLLYGVLLGGTFPLMIAYSAHLFPKYTTTRLAIIFSLTAVGMFLIPMVVGIAADYFLIYKILPFTAIPFLVYVFFFKERQASLII
jgi:MFS transporter, FHS family, glucose/mannose:H+ symporter